MSSTWKKIQKNMEDYAIKQCYQNMTPEMYQEGIRKAIKMTEERCKKDYEEELIRMNKQYNESIRNTTMVAMDTLAVEMIYELGNILECYKEDPEYLDQKIDIVQGLYETAMNSIGDYATDKYKDDKQARKAFNKKKDTILKVFHMGGMNKKNNK